MPVPVLTPQFSFPPASLSSCRVRSARRTGPRGRRTGAGSCLRALAPGWLAFACLAVTGPVPAAFAADTPGGGAAAAAPGSRGNLEPSLVPEPREMEMSGGSIAVGPQTRIVVGAWHAEEDRVAAETLADEIRSALGKAPRITTTRGVPAGADVIYLARLSDDPGLRAQVGTADGVGPEGYRLVARKGRILIGGVDAPGLFYGAQTLRQLLRPADAGRLACPAVIVRDWPAMRWRGVHDDLSRGPVPTLEFMKKQVRTLAEYKINLFALYLENVFAFRTHPLLGPSGGGALTPEEVTELVAYARRYHVTLLPEQQTFGHLHHLLKHEAYSELAERPHGHVLAPGDPRVYQLITDLYGELTPLFPGPFLHIGGDETFELGRGRSRARAEQEGLGKVYLEHLRKVADLLSPGGKRLLFWHDVAKKYPDLLHILPKDAIAVVWAYDPQPSFERHIKPFRDAGHEVFVAPGANNWNTIFPDQRAALENVRGFVEDGKRLGASGMLMTTWDDDGEALFELTWPSLVFSAGCAWEPGECRIERFEDRFDWVFFRNGDHRFRDALRELGSAFPLLAAADLGRPHDDVFWLDPFARVAERYHLRPDVLVQLRLSAERGLAAIVGGRSAARAHRETLDAFEFAARRLDFLGMKYLFAREITAIYAAAAAAGSNRSKALEELREVSEINGRLQSLRDGVSELRDLYSQRWLAENRPYWLGNVLVRYDGLRQVFQRKIERLAEARLELNLRSTPLPQPVELGFQVPPAAPPAAVLPARQKL